MLGVRHEKSKHRSENYANQDAVSTPFYNMLSHLAVIYLIYPQFNFDAKFDKWEISFTYPRRAGTFGSSNFISSPVVRDSTTGRGTKSWPAYAEAIWVGAGTFTPSMDG